MKMTVMIAVVIVTLLMCYAVMFHVYYTKLSFDSFHCFLTWRILMDNVSNTVSFITDINHKNSKIVRVLKIKPTGWLISNLLYSPQKAEQNLKKADLVSQEIEGMGSNDRDPQKRLQILMSLGRASLRAHKTGHALEAFEKVLNIPHILSVAITRWFSYCPHSR